MAQTIREAIDENAAIDKVFLEEPQTGERVSFQDVRDKAAELAALLHSMGMRKGDKAAVALQNGIAAGLSILGVMYAGGVVVSVNLGWKEKEFMYVINDSEASFLITTDEVLRDAGCSPQALTEESFSGVRVMRLASVETKPEEEGIPKAEDLALILYTSGTTGNPKGVMLTHRNLLAETGFIRQGHQLSREDSSLQVLPLFHINGLVIGFLTPFVTGCTLVMPARFSVSHFWEWIEEYRLTWVSAVPTIISMLLSRTPQEYMGAESMRFLRSASSPLPSAVLEEFEHRFQIPIVESFGISEGASQITVNPIDGVRKVGSVGIPMGNEVTIVDEDGKPLEAGSVGEVRIRGDNIFCGYYHKTEETEKSLREGWFYTGDLGWLDEDGYLFLKGRKKELINRAGEKFSPVEVDEVLYQIPGVELAAAVGVPDVLYNERVVAFLKLREGVRLSETDVIEACRGKLADFKIPVEIYFTDDFPKGPSGKIQRLKFIERYRNGIR